MPLTLEQVGVPLASERRQQRRRANDVREQERDRADRVAEIPAAVFSSHVASLADTLRGERNVEQGRGRATAGRRVARGRRTSPLIPGAFPSI